MPDLVLPRWIRVCKASPTASSRSGPTRLRRATPTEEINAELASSGAQRFDSTEALDRWLLDDVEPTEP